MNICITGALGHIGSQFIRSPLLKSFDSVYLIDNLLTQRYNSLFGLPRDIHYSFREIDILSKDITPIIKDCRILIHLAAITTPEESISKKEEIEKINKQGLERIAEVCSQSGCSLLFPSSTMVYTPKVSVVDENCSQDELQPQNPYAESKLYCERLLRHLGKEKKLRFVVLRLGTIFGYSPGMRFHTAVNRFIWQAVNGKPITVWKTALHQKRPYCDLKDGVEAINYVITKNLFDNQIYNIVTVNTTVQDILDIIKQYIPKINIQLVASPVMNELSFEASPQKSLKQGFSYSGDLKTSIYETILKLRNVNYKIPKAY